MVSAVGGDEYCERLRSGLHNNGVDSSSIITVPNSRSSIYFVIIENSTRENRCLFVRGVAASWKEFHFLRPEDLGPGIQPDLCVVEMEIYKEVVEQMIEIDSQAGIDFCLNVAPANPIKVELYQYVTHLLVNDSEAAIMSERELDDAKKDTWLVICQEFLHRGIENVVITLGRNGAYYANAMGNGLSPA